MTDKEQRAAAEKFAADWKGKGYEKGQSQAFWLSLLRDVYGIAHPETRRSGGMHYTSIENIHKVIDSLFLDGLKAEFETICEISVEKTKMVKHREFQKKLSSLTFLEIITSSLIQ